MARPKKEPTTIFPVRYNKARLITMRKRHGDKIHARVKSLLDTIYTTKRIPEQDAD